MKTFAVSLLLVIMGLGMVNAQYKIDKTKYDYKTWTDEAGDPYNPTTCGVLSFLIPIMDLVPHIVLNSGNSLRQGDTILEGEDEKVLTITGFELDTNISSFYHDTSGYQNPNEGRFNLPFYNWKWDIIEQQIFPKIYFDRFDHEKEKRYFSEIYSYFLDRAESRSGFYFNLFCLRYVEGKKALWKFPYDPDRMKHCTGLFPSSGELEHLYRTDLELYSSLMHWYSHGIGIPYPVFSNAAVFFRLFYTDVTPPQ